jgi:hypothetical protein
VPRSYYFCIKIALKLAYDHLYVLQQQNLGSLSLAMKGKDNKRRKGRGGRGEGRRDGGKGREGKRKGQGVTAPKFGDLSSPLASNHSHRQYKTLDQGQTLG